MTRMQDETALVALLIIERALCVDCIAKTSRIRRGDVEPRLARIGTTIALTSTVDRCRVCARTTDVHSARRE